MAKKLDGPMESWIRGLTEKTGKSLDEWVALAKQAGDVKHGAVVKHLQDAHGLTHGYASMVAHVAAGKFDDDAPSGDDLVDAQYAGDKAALRPIYDRLAREVRKFGKDVDIAPKKAYVSLRRGSQFAFIQPSTKTRVDVGIKLKTVPAKGRLEASGAFSSNVSHRVRLESVKDIDAELIGWLRQAYDAAT